MSCLPIPRSNRKGSQEKLLPHCMALRSQSNNRRVPSLIPISTRASPVRPAHRGVPKRVRKANRKKARFSAASAIGTPLTEVDVTNAVWQGASMEPEDQGERYSVYM